MRVSATAILFGAPRSLPISTYNTISIIRTALGTARCRNGRKTGSLAGEGEAVERDARLLAQGEVGEYLTKQWTELESVPAAPAADHDRSH
jgi:hypothetical protein